VIRARGIRSEIGAPVVVDGQVWGALIAGRDTDDPAQEGAELRLASFAELVATAVSNATARSELVASRARLVTAADDARRRLERNLHDGAQQRLVSLGLKVRAAEELVPGGLAELRSELDGVVEGLESLLEEVREISHGLHPAILSQAGLGAALRSLAARSSVPVEVDVALDERPMESVEIAAYYVVSEALANAAKHAEATLVRVSSQVVDGHLRLTVADDGVGGALADRGSGLSGLCDRVEALGGRLALTSPRGGGTTVEVDLPVAGPSG
jgi:signal transduction histidine kinase